MKKTSIIIAVCLLLAVISIYKFFIASDSVGIDSLSSGDMTWIKCKNCQAESQMNLREFYTALEEETRKNPSMVIVTPGLICEKCSKNSIYQAIKCPNTGCEVVFFKGSVPRDNEDRCPKCGYSEIEETRNKRKSQ